MAEEKQSAYDVLVLHGGSREALAYHIGFVITLIREGKLKHLKSVFGVGASALLAARLAWAWPLIVDKMTQTSENRTDWLMKILNDPFTHMLMEQNSSVWKLDIEGMTAEHEWPCKTADDDPDDSDTHSVALSDWSVESLPTVFIGKNIPDTMKICVLRSGSQANALFDACGIETKDVRSSAPYVNIISAFRTLCTVSGHGLRFIVSSPDEKCMERTWSDVEVYPMHASVSKGALEHTTTVLDGPAFAALRQLGYEDCHRRDLGIPRKTNAPSIMQTPRRASSIASDSTASTDSLHANKPKKPSACTDLCSSNWFTRKSSIVIEEAD
jgi:hypothetical protein